jgi:hypothetical protein
MPPLVRRLIPKKFLIVVSCALSVSIPISLALAQHTAARSAGGVVHTSTPPISRVPISSAPVIHAPISIPRISASSAGALGTAGFRPPRRPIRPFPPVLVVYESPVLFGGPFWGLNSCWSATCDLFGSWTLGYTTAYSPGPVNDFSPVYETPVYVYGEETPDLPQLVLKDGTILNVTDYWLVDNQLHFTIIEENVTKPAEHVIPFEALELQTTIDANTRRGFRFVLRNAPVEQYLRDHPEDLPHIATPPYE